MKFIVGLFYGLVLGPVIIEVLIYARAHNKFNQANDVIMKYNALILANRASICATAISLTSFLTAIVVITYQFGFEAKILAPYVAFLIFIEFFSSWMKRKVFDTQAAASAIEENRKRELNF